MGVMFVIRNYFCSSGCKYFCVVGNLWLPNRHRRTGPDTLMRSHVQRVSDTRRGRSRPSESSSLHSVSDIPITLAQLTGTPTPTMLITHQYQISIAFTSTPRTAHR